MLGIKKLVATGAAAAVMLSATALPTLADYNTNNWNNYNNSGCNCQMSNQYSNNYWQNHQMDYNKYNTSDNTRYINYQPVVYHQQSMPVIDWNNWYMKKMNGRMVQMYLVKDYSNNRTGYCWYDTNHQLNYEWD